MTNPTTYHPEELALLRAVCLAPEDDTPRLVLADWYDEQHVPLLSSFAEFIRAHISYCRLPDDSKFRRRKLTIAALAKILDVPAGCDNAGNLWAARLLGRNSVTGYTRPEKWDRGFPAFAKFGSYFEWSRSANGGLYPDRLYERVPLVTSTVEGRHPVAYRHPRLTPRNSPFYWRWRRNWLYTGGSSRGEDNLPPKVYDMLSKSDALYEFNTDACKDAWRAFTDAGRVACGLPPRHKQLQDPTAKGSST